MSQPSKLRWNTGKRGAAFRKYERFGAFYVQRNFHRYVAEYGHEDSWVYFALRVRKLFPNSPKLIFHILRGAERWIENQSVEFLRMY